MANDVPTIAAEHELACQNSLGEGVLWDSKTQLLHWVDINDAEIHTYDPETKAYGVDSYKGQSDFVSAIALRKDKPGFIGLLQHEIAFFPAPSRPASTDAKPKRTDRKAEVIASPLPKDPVQGKPTRMNDGGCDPQGSFIAGSMTIPEVGDATKRGQLWKYDPDGTETQLFDAIGCSNGIGWSPDGSTLYYIDSADHEIQSFTYNSGKLSDRKILATTPPPMAPATKTTGVFDGLCMDGVGNIWVARWSDERVIGYTPKGEIICNISLPKAKNITIPCFGGKNLETMYIVSAHAAHGGNGDIQDQYPRSGDLFKVDFSAGSEVRKLLGVNWKGAERHRFGG